MRKANVSDEQLAQAFKSLGETSSFEKLYLRYIQKVYRTCLRMTHDPQTAQDYAHDIFLKVFDRLPSFANRSSFSTWLYTITYRYCLDQLALNQRRKIERLGVVPLSNEPSDESNEALIQLVEERMQAQEAILAQLSEDEQTLLRLKYEQGLSIRVLSQRLDLSESVVKMRLKRSRDKLQQFYEGPT